MDRSIEMRNGKIGSLLWKFSLPAITGMLVNALYNIIDRIFVGRGVGPLAIAATTVAFPIMLIMMGVSILIGVGATALISIRLGEQKKEEAERVAGNGMIMLIILPLILTAVYFLFSEPILKIFGASEDVFPYARDFTQIIMVGSVLGSIGMGMNNFIRAEGNPGFAMFTQIIGALINGVLNYIFIFRLGLGIKGSALATVCAQFISATWVLGYFGSGRSLVKIRLKNLKLQLPILTGIMSIGFAPFAMQITNSVQQLILNKTLMSYGGDLALSAVGIMMSIGALVFMPILGISQGAQPIIGFNYGARQYHRVKETLKKAVVAGTCIALAFYLVIHIWPNQIAGLFSKDNITLTRLTAHAMLVFFAMLPVIAFQIICSHYFQAVGKPVQSTILALSRQVLLFIPLLLILPRIWGIEGVWRTAPIADALSVILTASLIYLEMKNLPGSRPLEQTAG
ncbi:MATE family efflux transporter [Desulfallas sp. Bu1-1]|uniref:MATE family efflux transporter n=1 Tax=Desulfallas sp. Bu1-1 TaxID=2787620 RepID=UPI00189C8108|nr:MATE family efflux transporter [Desulfallas sp. Bu1-1]MBF7082918.1 MATE family efflux transporter [Desulfallas sp. Bu1-1]